MKLDGASSVLCRPTQITNPSSLFEEHNVEITDRINQKVRGLYCVLQEFSSGDLTFIHLPLAEIKAE